jgi:hypothetical protein
MPRTADGSAQTSADTDNPDDRSSACSGVRKWNAHRTSTDAQDLTDELTRRGVRLNLGGSIHDPTDPVGPAAQGRSRGPDAAGDTVLTGIPSSSEAQPRRRSSITIRLPAPPT